MTAEAESLQRQIVELRRDIEAAATTHAALITYQCAQAVKTETQGRLLTTEEVTWVKRGLQTSIDRSKSLSTMGYDLLKAGAWGVLAFTAWALWESFKQKVGSK